MAKQKSVQLSLQLSLLKELKLVHFIVFFLWFHQFDMFTRLIIYLKQGVLIFGLAKHAEIFSPPGGFLAPSGALLRGCYNQFSPPPECRTPSTKVHWGSKFCEKGRDKAFFFKIWNPIHNPISDEYWIQALFRSYNIK